jgi:hypothetical protein
MARGGGDRRQAEQGGQVSGAEANMLDRLGFGEPAACEVGARETTGVDFDLFVRESPTLEQAAKSLKLSSEILIHRLKIRRLYGFKAGRIWRIPRFQWDRKGQLVPGIDKVFPHIRADAHPLAIARWFTSPHPDLVADGEEGPVTPLAWLAAGKSPGTVADLAQEI